MSATAIELDLFGLDKKKSSSKSQFQRLLDQPRNVRDVQAAISKFNPNFLSTAIGSGGPSLSFDGFQKQDHLVSPPNCGLPSTKNMPVFMNHVSSRAASENDPRTMNAPLTIFYNGTVSVFNVPQDKAEMIMKLAEEVQCQAPRAPAPAAAVDASGSNEQKLLEKLNGGDLPIARKKSLLRFLEKRKERLTVSPYSGKGSETVGAGGQSK